MDKSSVKGNKIKLLGIIAAMLGIIALPMVKSLSARKYAPPPKRVIAELLGWVPTPVSLYSLCGGYFYEPKNIRNNPTPAPYKSLPTKITAKGPTVFSKTGESILQKEVRVMQTGRSTTADKAYIYRDKNTGKITHIKLVGHVSMQEHDKLLVGTHADLDLKKNTAQINNVAYHIAQDNPHMGHNNGWGTAEKGNRLPSGIVTLEHATYSTCSPLSPTWQMSATHIKLDRETGRGAAHNAVLRLFGIPILYTPYISFSMNNTRKSGILAPLVENSSKSGFTLSVPYYWNMAPNYDMTITPVYFSKRGMQFNSLFRYLTENSRGSLYVSYLPGDHAFKKFKNDSIAEFPAPVDPVYEPYINALRKEHNYRGYFAFDNKTRFNKQWELNTQINYVTDPYYFRDFGATINDVVANQLLNQVDLKYAGVHWNLFLMAQAYQTLHLIDQSDDLTVNQYMRLPELDTSADYPNIFSGVDFNLNMQAINFAYHSVFPPETDTLPIGQRYHARPTLSRPINWATGYLTPSVSFDSTTYNIEQPQSGQSPSSSRNIPIADIDSGLYFDRRFSFGGRKFTQTFEPRLFYLYVPYENQDRYPVYDTQLLPFTYSQLFAVNRFTGFDRLQNANQASFGVTSRILRADNAAQLFNASIGIGYYFDRPKVCLTPGCDAENERLTPLATQFTYYPTQHWAITGNFAWDTELSQTNNIQANISYTRDGQHIIGTGYTFVHAQPSSPDYSITSFSSDSALYNIFFSWPLTDHWSTLGYLYYNVTNHRPENYFAGLQYDTCCISLRFIVDRSYLGTLPVASGTRTINQYSTNYIIQIQLKGIGSAGNTNPNAMLTSDIPGYHDPFKY